MSSISTLAEVAALVGDPARAAMLEALLAGRSLTAKELALHARVAPSTASGHLAQLTAGGLLAVDRGGRHRYFRLASARVAAMLEGLMGVVADRPAARPRALAPRDEALRQARTCYDHLAGRLGVAIADGLVGQGHLLLSAEGGELTESGATHLQRQLGLDICGISAGRRVFCRSCLDWTERRAHLAGALGAAIAERCLVAGWVERLPATRALRVTPAGSEGLAAAFGFKAQ